MIKYYIDSTNGNDTNLGLTIDSPKLTLNSVSLNFVADETYKIYLTSSDIAYEINQDILSRVKTNTTIYIIGEGSKTILNQIKGYWSNSSGGEATATIYFCKLIYNMSQTSNNANLNCLKMKLFFYNVLFTDVISNVYSVWAFQNDGVFYNCILNGKPSCFIRKNKSTIKVYNSYGCFTSGYNTSDSDWDTGTNYITASIDDIKLTDKYKIDDKNIANNIGLYSGDYNWGVPFLLKINNEYYTIIDSQLQQITDNITKDVISQYGIITSELNNNINLLQDSFQIISGANQLLQIKSIKEKTSMIVASNSFPTTIQTNIDYFENQVNLSNNGSIKLAFSIDNGVTWKSYKDGLFTDLSITIPLKPYKDLSESEITQWNSARDKIYSDGIASSDLKSIDFNSLNMRQIRFAYVLHIDSTSDSAQNKKLLWQFDAKGSMKKMKDTEVDIEVASEAIKVTPLIDASLIRVNISDGIVSDVSLGNVYTNEDKEKLDNLTAINVDIIKQDVVNKVEDVPVGSIIMVMNTVAPTHYLACDGSTYNISDYPYLAEYIKNKLGSYDYWGGDGEITFAVPDMRGEFVRGYDSNNTRDPQGSTRGIGKHQDATQFPMFGGDNTWNIWTYRNSTNNTAMPTNMDSQKMTTDGQATRASILDNSDANWRHGESYTSRPTNVNTLFCIKYEPTYYIQNYTPTMGYMESIVLFDDIANTEETDYELTHPIDEYDKIVVYTCVGFTDENIPICSTNMAIDTSVIKYNASEQFDISVFESTEDYYSVAFTFTDNTHIRYKYSRDSKNWIGGCIYKIIGYKCSKEKLSPTIDIDSLTNEQIQALKTKLGL